MDDIEAKIAVKQKQIQVEVLPEKKAEYQKQLRKLQLRKQIKILLKRIEQLRPIYLLCC